MVRFDSSSGSARALGLSLAVAAASALCTISMPAPTFARPPGTISGTVMWTDAQGMTHPARRHRVEVYHVSGMGPGPGGATHLARVYTDLMGFYTAGVFLPAGMGGGVAMHAFSDTGMTPGAGGGYVFRPPPAGPPVRPPPPIGMDFTDDDAIYRPARDTAYLPPLFDYTLDLTLPGFPAEAMHNRAFSVSDALYTGWYYSSQVRGAAGGAPEVPVVFPVGGAASFYTSGPPKLHILEGHAFDWDVILHEYGHYLADIDDMARGAPGGAHTIGTSNIPAHGKSDGIRLAWSEGLATYLGIAAQHVNPAAQNLPGSMGNPAMANVGDVLYTDTLQDFHVSLETLEVRVGMATFNTRGQGEGDELPVARILWDLADPANEPYDRISHGHVGLYNILNNDIAGLMAPGPGMPALGAHLSTVWNHFFNLPGITDATRVDYGAIFEEHGVSPHPVGGPIGMTLDPAGPAPTFAWERRNNGENDRFELLIFNSDLSARLLEISDTTIPFLAEGYTLTAEQWAMLAPPVPTTYRFVVTGRDSLPVGLTGAWVDTGRYWSDAYSFTVIPAPGALALAAVGVICCVRRRQVRRGGGGTLGA